MPAITADTLWSALHAIWDQDPTLGSATPPIALYDDNPEAAKEYGSYVILEALDEPENLMDSAGGKFVEASWRFRWQAQSTRTQREAREKALALAALIGAAFNDASKPVLTGGQRLLLLTRAGFMVRLDESVSTPSRLVAEAELSYRAQLVRHAS